MSSGVGADVSGTSRVKEKKGGPGARGQRIVLHKLHVLTQTTPILDSTPCKRLSSCFFFLFCFFLGGERLGGGRTSGVG